MSLIIIFKTNKGQLVIFAVSQLQETTATETNAA